VVVLAEDNLLVSCLLKLGPPGSLWSGVGAVLVVGYREHVGHGGDPSHPVPVPRRTGSEQAYCVRRGCDLAQPVLGCPETRDTPDAFRTSR